MTRHHFRPLRSLVLVLLAGCSLPLSSEVHPVGEVPAENRRVAGLQVIPPGPRADATPVEAVLGFLGAQASSADRHAIARRFLTNQESERWRDEGEVQVYDPDRLVARALPSDTAGEAIVRVVSWVLGRVREDGSYVATASHQVVEDYRLTRVQGSWRLEQVPDGLRLTAADRQRALAPHSIFYLAPRTAGDPAHLVPDHVFLPVEADLAGTLVGRLLRPPTQVLLGSVTTAVPEGTRARSVSLSAAGVVAVDLTGFDKRPSGQQAQDLSAQLVWTLRSLGPAFRGLRLLADGRPLSVPGEGEMQPSGAWEGYDPEGLGPRPPYFFSAHRRLRASVELLAGPATAGEVGDGRAVAVDAAAVTPDRTRVALLDGAGSGPTIVRIGPLRGRSFPVVARGTALSSPTWGRGALGLWLVSEGRTVLRVAGGLRAVPVPNLPPGRISSLALSRDGVRVALVVAGRLYVGRIEVVEGTPNVVDLAPALPALRQATRVVWSSSTELVVLGTLTRSRQALRVSVDGSSVEALNTAGLTPTEVAASPAGIVLLSHGRLYLSEGGPFRQVQSEVSRAPAFPG